MFVLETLDGRLCLRALHRPDYGPVCADWLQPEVRRRVQGGRRQLLARALGLHRHPQLRLLDATAGLGRDAYTLAALGAQVDCCERQPLTAALFDDALRRLGEREPLVAARLRRLPGGALERLVEPGPGWDAILLDPMYPHDGKTALPQKTLQLLRDLAGDDEDADALLAPALARAPRVAVKRPLSAPWLAGRAPSLSLRGTQARFDVYLAPPPSRP